jgi:hypothetical protein
VPGKQSSHVFSCLSFRILTRAARTLSVNLRCLMEASFILDQETLKMELPKKFLVPSNQTKIKGS